MKRISILALLATACGYKAEEFQTDYADAVCTLTEDCALLGVSDSYEDLADCLSQVQDSVVAESCEFDRDLAQACVDAVNAMSCDDLYNEAWPESCETACP